MAVSACGEMRTGEWLGPLPGRGRQLWILGQQGMHQMVVSGEDQAYPELVVTRSHPSGPARAAMGSSSLILPPFARILWDLFAEYVQYMNHRHAPSCVLFTVDPMAFPPFSVTDSTGIHWSSESEATCNACKATVFLAQTGASCACIVLCYAVHLGPQGYTTDRHLTWIPAGSFRQMGIRRRLRACIPRWLASPGGGEQLCLSLLAAALRLPYRSGYCYVNTQNKGNDPQQLSGATRSASSDLHKTVEKVIPSPDSFTLP
ncbi:hypothetical protein GQ53DRAFT_772559 [Thozetella sp. PMI_491]|nr:hypothetical protein GQ53DRAFT_772559 [Thozetella sp. PMI_491]